MSMHGRRMTIRNAWWLFWPAALLLLFGFWYDGNEIVRPSPEVLARGKELYHTACASCHGNEGRGDGLIAANLRTKPRDLSRGVFKNRSTMSGQLPTDYDLYETVTTGIHNTPMPRFRGWTPEDRRAVVEFIKTLSSRFSDPEEYPLEVVSIGDEPTIDPQGIAKGKDIYVSMKCGDCHGSSGRGDGETVKKQVDELGDPIDVLDLTNPSQYKFAHNARDIYRVLSTGLDGTPMPSYLATIAESDRWALAHYIWSLRDGYHFFGF